MKKSISLMSVRRQNLGYAKFRGLLVSRHLLLLLLLER